MDMNLNKLWEMVKDRGACHPAVHGVKKSWTQLSNWTTTKFSQFSCSVVSDSLRPRGLQHTSFPIHHQLPEPAQIHVHWVGDAIQPSPSVIPFSCLQSCPASGSFPVSQFFESGGQSIGASASASVLPMNIQDWFPLGLTGWISLQSNGLSRIFFHITVQKHQFFGAQPSLWSNTHIHTWQLEKPKLLINFLKFYSTI